MDHYGWLKNDPWFQRNIDAYPDEPVEIPIDNFDPGITDLFVYDGDEGEFYSYEPWRE